MRQWNGLLRVEFIELVENEFDALFFLAWWCRGLVSSRVVTQHGSIKIKAKLNTEALLCCDKSFDSFRCFPAFIYGCYQRHSYPVFSGVNAINQAG